MHTQAGRYIIWGVRPRTCDVFGLWYWGSDLPVSWRTRRNICAIPVSAYSLCYVKWRHAQNRKHITHFIAVRGGPSHNYRRWHVQKIRYAYAVVDGGRTPSTTFEHRWWPSRANGRSTAGDGVSENATEI